MPLKKSRKTSRTLNSFRKKKKSRKSSKSLNQMSHQELRRYVQQCRNRKRTNTQKYRSAVYKLTFKNLYPSGSQERRKQQKQQQKRLRKKYPGVKHSFS